MESEDFLHWTDRRVIIERQVGDPVLMDHYGLVASRRHDMMIGFLWESQWWDLGGKHGQIRGRLVVSRDHGHHWERVDGEKPFFDLGPQHAFDAGTVYPSTILTIGDEDFIYYTGTRITHAPMPRSEFPNDAYSIGVARIPRDRFVGRRAGAAEGVLVSRAFPMPPHRALFLNCSTGSNGYCRVFVESAENGSTLLAGIDFLGDSLDGEIAWQEGSPENVTGQLVRLRFQMREASLYGFRFTP